MAVDTLAIAERLERSGLAQAQARAVAVEIADLHEATRREVVTREYLDLALGKLRAEVERDIAELRAATTRDIAELRAELERQISEVRQDIGRIELRLEGIGNRLLIWLSAIIGLGITIVGGLGVLF